MTLEVKSVEKVDLEVGIVLEPMECMEHLVLSLDRLGKTLRVIAPVNVSTYVSKIYGNIVQVNNLPIENSI